MYFRRVALPGCLHFIPCTILLNDRNRGPPKGSTCKASVDRAFPSTLVVVAVFLVPKALEVLILSLFMSEGWSPGAANIDDGNSGSPKGRETITIDSQSFVNVGQLMESRGHSIFTGGSTNLAGSCSIISCSDSDVDGLRDFDQIVHPGSSASPWSGQERCAGEQHVEEEDDTDSVLPALPCSPAPGSPTGSDAVGRMTSGRHPFNDEHESGWSHEFGGRETAPVQDDHDETVVAESSLSEDPTGHSVLKFIATGDHVGQPENKQPVSILTAQCDPNGDRETFVESGGAQPSDSEERMQSITGAPSLADEEDTKQIARDTAGTVEVRFPSGSLRESWLHVPTQKAHAGIDQKIPHESTSVVEASGSVEQKEGSEDMEHRRTATCKPREMDNDILPGRNVFCLSCVVQKAIALAQPPLQFFTQLASVPMEAGADMLAKLKEAVTEGQRAIMRAIDDVPQAPVRLWVGRVAGSLVLGAILGGAIAYFAFPRALAPSTPTADADASTNVGSGASSSWSASPEQSQQRFQADFGSSGEAGRNFGDRLNRALLAARAGEVAAQQGLLEEVRDILAATGKSGGISAEQILRQFNAKRFAEASKVWAAAEGFMSTDPLYFTSPGKPYTPSAPPYPSPAPPSTFDASSCTIGGSSPCNVDVGDAMDHETAGGARTFHARGGGVSSGSSTLDGKARTMRVRSCGGGGWVC